MVWEYTARGNLVAVVTNGTAVLGLGNIGPLAGKPVMEGKACLFKKFADIDVYRPGGRRARLGALHRRRRRAGADLRRHQPRGPEGAGVLRDRGRAARAHGDPGLPRRSARHGHHLGRRAAQRRRDHRQEAGRSQDRHLRRRRLGDRLRQLLRLARRLPGEHHHGRFGRGDLRGARAGDEPVEGAVRAQGRRRPDARRCAARRRPVPGPLEGGALHGRDAEDDGAAAARLRAGQPRSGDRLRRGEGGAAGRHRRHRTQRFPQPGQQRPRLPLRLPRGARRARQGDQRGDEDRRRARAGRAGARAGARLRRRGLRRERVQVRSRLHHPQAVRHRASSGGARRRWPRRP